MSTQPARSSYIGRFAPSPSGQLHFGSLVTALDSYLDARHHEGSWLVRMEDIDEPRCIAGVDKTILNTLDVHGLRWDGAVVYQTQQHERYQDTLNSLIADKKAYYCTCTRKQIKAKGGRYQGTCRGNHAYRNDAAIRLILNTALPSFEDGIQGQVSPEYSLAEDIIIKRRDGLFAYNLVVALDDDFQGVTHIVRGNDLLDVTPLQLCVYDALGLSIPQYCHIPVASVSPGRKLSKQNHAVPICNKNAMENLTRALAFLGFSHINSTDYDTVDTLLNAAIERWDRKVVPNVAEIIVDRSESTYHSDPL